MAPAGKPEDANGHFHHPKLAALPTLVEQRAEIRRAQAEIEAAELTVLVAQASNRLRITLDGRASQALTPTTQSVYSVTGVVSLPISDAGREAWAAIQETAVGWTPSTMAATRSLRSGARP